MADRNASTPPPIEALIPHRGPMRLIEAIVETGPDFAATIATVREGWPLREGDGVSPLVIIELAAQTAAVSIGWQRWRSGGGLAGRGWLVGIREAVFFMTGIPLEAPILTRSRVQLSLDDYTEVVCVASVQGKPAGEVTLQVMRDSRSADDLQQGPS